MESEITDLKKSVADIAKHAATTKWIVIGGIIINVALKLLSVGQVPASQPPAIPHADDNR